MLFSSEDRLVFRYEAEQLWIEPWGENALRVRATKCASMPTEDWALQTPAHTRFDITVDDKEGSITNGKIKANLTARGKLTIRNQKGHILLEEYARHRKDAEDPKCSALNVQAREFKAKAGGNDYHLTMRLESVQKDEKIYGMGQYQQPYLDLKGLDIEMAQRNSQASVPFALSSLGYGLLWNNPGVGRAVFGKNVMSFEAYSTRVMDYWIVAGDEPAEISEAYAKATGTVPMMPEYGLGFWQCKLRYQTQEELLGVAREHKRRGLPMDVIVCDFFHWPTQGEWRFDPVYWPDPDAMVKELQSLGIELMVSIWPTVDKKSPLYPHMLENGYLTQADRGYNLAHDFQGDCLYYDATNPEARQYLWKTCQANYYSKGIKVFWLDEAEPEYSVYDYDNYRYHAGSVVSVGNIYPREYAKTFYEGMTAAGQSNVLNLLRCAWAGSQKFGALVWSGDIASSWPSFRNQLAAGLNMGVAGIPWWTTDIGGFHGGNPDDPAFRELLVRWFQWGAFCPVMRLHGDREPRQNQVGDTGGATCRSGAANEVWSYGDDVYKILIKYINIRERMKDYIRSLMKVAHEKGLPVIRTMFYEFPQDKTCWEVEDQYMFGDKFLCAPIMEPGQRKRKLYLPKDAKWKAFTEAEEDSGKDQAEHKGGQFLEVDCPLESMPVFVRQ